jgi:hypothetical protein
MATVPQTCTRNLTGRRTCCCRDAKPEWPCGDKNAGASADALAALAARLTHPGNRYAAILSYIQRLPPTDEFRQLMDLMGSLTLLSQHIPDATAEFLEAFRLQTRN